MLAIMLESIGISEVFGCSLFNEAINYSEYEDSPLYTENLDAERYFDNISYKLLFYKILNDLPRHHRVLYHIVFMH